MHFYCGPCECCFFCLTAYILNQLAYIIHYIGHVYLKMNFIAQKGRVLQQMAIHVFLDVPFKLGYVRV
jgi:hypothetical protein